MNRFSIVLLGFYCLFLMGCARKSAPLSTIQDHVIYRESLTFMPIVKSADTATIRAYLRCDSMGRVLLSYYDAQCSINARLKFQLDSLGNLRADFNTRTDTVYVPVKNKTYIKTKTVTIRVEVPAKLNMWQKLSQYIALLSIGIATFYIIRWIRKIKK